MPCFWVRRLGESLRTSGFSLKRYLVRTVAHGLGRVAIREEQPSAPLWIVGPLTGSDLQLSAFQHLAQRTVQSRLACLGIFSVAQNRNPLKLAQDKTGA